MDAACSGDGWQREDLPFVRAVLNEALRLYPPSWSYARAALVDQALGGRHVPRGSSVWVVSYLLQRDPRWWRNPDTFDPDRWLDGSQAGRPQLAFIPFSAGMHKCLGHELAMREMTAVVPAVLRRWRLASQPVEEPRRTTQPLRGLPVFLEARA